MGSKAPIFFQTGRLIEFRQTAILALSLNQAVDVSQQTPRKQSRPSPISRTLVVGNNMLPTRGAMRGSSFRTMDEKRKPGYKPLNLQDDA